MYSLFSRQHEHILVADVGVVHDPSPRAWDVPFRFVARISTSPVQLQLVFKISLRTCLAGSPPPE